MAGLTGVRRLLFFSPSFLFLPLSLLVAPRVQDNSLAGPKPAEETELRGRAAEVRYLPT